MRLAFIGLGPLGRRLARDAASRRLGTIAAAVDVDPALQGQPLRTHVPEVESDARISSELDQDVDVAVVATLSQLERCAPTFRALLERGLTVVSTCEELSWPRLKHPQLADELDALARQHSGRLLGTGINPGFLMDTFPAIASTVCGEVRGVTVTRVQDAGARRIPFQRKVGATLDQQTFRARIDAGELGHVGLPESLHFLAHALGVTLESYSDVIEPVLAEDELGTDIGEIPSGGVRGLHQVAEGAGSDGTTLRLVFRAAIGEPESYDRVQIDGSPPVDLVWKGGVHGDVATSAVLLNSIRPLRAAAPGLHTMASIPLASFTRSAAR